MTVNPAFDRVPLLGPGLCGCGCGKPAPAGKQRCHGHHSQSPAPYYTETQCGYVDPVTNLPSACHLWARKAKNQYGYGMAWDAANKTPRPAHIIAWERYYERPVPVAHQLDHLCRQPGCVNPTHLTPVTVAENMRRKPQTKLNVERVRQIRTEANDITLTHEMIAERHGVSRSTVTGIVNCVTWKGI